MESSTLLPPVLFLAVFLLLKLTSAADPYFQARCVNSENFTNSITYGTNLNNLFSQLSSTTSEFNYGFYNLSVGRIPDQVNAIGLCRGDQKADACRSCLNDTVSELKIRCPNYEEAVGYAAVCTVHYSSQVLYRAMASSPEAILYNIGNASSDTDQLNQVLVPLLNNLKSRAAAGGPLRKYAADDATGPIGVAYFVKIYALVQCTPDLSQDECSTCLTVATARINEGCINGSIGCRILQPSCNLRYEIPKFFDSEITQPSPQPSPPVINGSNKSKLIQIVGSSIGILGLIALISFAFVIWRRRNNKSEDVPLLDFGGKKIGNDGFSNEELQGENVEGSQEFPSIKLDIIIAATQNFCEANKLGEGGFGPVYKGILTDGKELAVKRLSKTSGQGLLEFKNEVILIARLQHRNLVKLLGCCLENNEKLLVYEYMPNRSLDVFLFDAKLRMQLDWQRRFRIISGIARGILYLHEDSRLRIIHRDLKVSNILLDNEMNPKISDFGLARIFGGNQNEASTNRIVGTYGYMAPEYAMEGLFSVKSDVFSFGVLLLEIISGKKNNGFYFYERGESLLTYAWKLWLEGQGVELIDQVLVQEYVKSEVLKCIHIGLLCVQKDPADRPNMSSVIHMLVSDGIALPKPTEPAFSVGRVTAQETLPSRDNIINSVNIDNVEPR